MSVKVRRISEEPGLDEREEGYSGVNSIWVVLERVDITGFSSRIFRIEPGGHTSVHSHDREHVAIVIRGVVRVNGGPYTSEAGEGNIITIPRNIPHRFSNLTRERLVLLIMNLFTGQREPEAGKATGG